MKINSSKYNRNLLRVFFVLQAGYFLTQFCKIFLGRGELWGLTALFDLDRENSLPTYFEALLFLHCSALLYLIHREERSVGSVWRRHWKWLSYIFVYLSVDEASSIHEKLNKPIRLLFHIHGGMFYFAWTVMGLVLILFLAVSYWKFCAHLPPKFLRRFILSGVIFVSGALAMEFFSGTVLSLQGDDNWTYLVLSWLEETMEMTGLLLFIRALFSWHRERRLKLEVHFE